MGRMAPSPAMHPVEGGLPAFSSSAAPGAAPVGAGRYGGRVPRGPAGAAGSRGRARAGGVVYGRVEGHGRVLPRPSIGLFVLALTIRIANIYLLRHHVTADMPKREQETAAGQRLHRRHISVIANIRSVNTP